MKFQRLQFYFLWIGLPGWLMCNAALAQIMDLSGKPIQPLQSAKVVVLIFVRTDCPISNRYAPEIKRLAEKFQSEKMKIFVVYPGKDQTPELIKKHLTEFSFEVEAVRDPQHQFVKSLGMTVTPEAVVWTQNRLMYRGRIDNRFVAFGKIRIAPTSHDLENVLTAVSQGKPITKKITKAIGCFIS